MRSLSTKMWFIDLFSPSHSMSLRGFFQHTMTSYYHSPGVKFYQKRGCRMWQGHNFCKNCVPATSCTLSFDKTSHLDYDSKRSSCVEKNRAVTWNVKERKDL